MSSPAPSLLGQVPRVLGYLRPHRNPFAAGIGLTLLGVGFDVLKPLPLAFVLDVVLGHQPVLGMLRGIAEPSGKFGLLVAASLAIVLVTLARGASSLGANYLLIGVAQRMVNDLRTELYAHLQKLSLSFHSRQQTGDLLYRVMSDTYSIQGMLMNGLLPLASSAVMLENARSVTSAGKPNCRTTSPCVGSQSRTRPSSDPTASTAPSGENSPSVAPPPW